MSQSPTSPARIEAAEKQALALKYRKAGYTYDMIAERVGYASASGAEKAIKSALHKMLRDEVQDVLDFELARLDEMMAGAYIMATGGNPAAIASVLKIMERRAKLLGLDAPVKTYNFNVEIVSRAWEAIEASGVNPTEAFERIIAKAAANANSG